MNRPFDSITDFIFVEKEPAKSDIILIPGGMQAELMEKAVELYNKGLAPYLLPSGGVGPKLAKEIADSPWNTEWEFLQNIAVTKGVPEKAILKEDKSTHTFDNAIMSWDVIQQNKITVKKAILVCKAFHARRALLTYQTVFPSDVEFFVCPIVEYRNITKENWFLDEVKIGYVMSEVEKIGQRFAKHIPNWNKS